MTLSLLLSSTVQNIHNNSLTIALGTAISAGSSYLVTRFTSSPLIYSNPATVAKFTAVAGLALCTFNQITKNTANRGLETRKSTNPTLALASKLTLFSLAMYGVHLIANPEKNLASFIKLSIQATASLFLANRLFNSESALLSNLNSYFDRMGGKMGQNLFLNIFKIPIAAGAAWIAAHAINKLGIDSPLDFRVTMIFTAAASTLYYATQPMFSTAKGLLQSPMSRNGVNLFQFIFLLKLTRNLADSLHLNLPLYKEFAKTCAIAAGLIFVTDRLIPNPLPGENGNFGKDIEEQNS